MTAETAPIEAPMRRQLMRRVFHSYLAPHLPGFVTALVCAAIVGGLTAVLAWLLEPAVRHLLIEKDAQALIAFPLLIVAVGLLRGVAQFGQVILTNRIGNGLVGRHPGAAVRPPAARSTWRGCARPTPAPTSPRSSTTPA